MASGITRCAYLWTLFTISLLFGGAYAILLERSGPPSASHGLIVLKTLARALLLP
jgi:hypothetical protein